MNKQVIDEDTQNEKVLESMEADFDTFLHNRDFKNAQAVIDNLCDMNKWSKAGELLIRLTAAKMRVPADYGFQKKPYEPADPEYDKYSTREYYERTEAEFGSPF